MATQDIRLERIVKEYGSLRGAQSRRKLLDNRDLLRENNEMLRENNEMLRENREMLRAIIKHLDVPYKPPMGFSKE